MDQRWDPGTGRVAIPVPRDTADGGTACHATWDVRVVRIIDEVTAAAVLQRLVAGAPLQADGLTVRRSGPAVSVRWLGSLHATRVPVRVSRARRYTAGHVELLVIGAASAEVRVCLVGRGLVDRVRGWPRLHRLADAVGAQLLAAGRPRPGGSTAAESGSRTPAPPGRIATARDAAEPLFARPSVAREVTRHPARHRSGAERRP